MEKKYSRICPKCATEIFHTNKGNCKSSEKKEKQCNDCKGKVFKESFKGEKNPFFGKKHSKETICKITGSTDYSFTQTEEYRHKMSKAKSGINAPMRGRSVYSVWLKEYGKEKADEKMLSLKKKQSENSKGSKNNMFGKPSPQGSGNGWCGWYKGWHFRSLLELSLVINFIERFKFNWKNAEKKEYMVKYFFMNEEKNYFPDFILNKKYLIECKPKNLRNTPLVLAKKEAAIIFCKEKNLKYKMITPQKLTNKQIVELHDSGKIKFSEKYEIKYKEKYG